MMFPRTHRRLVVICLVVFLPLMTLLVAEGLAQMRLAGTMTDAAGRLLGSLSSEQKARVNYSFDTLERFNWHYIPRMRKGLALRELLASVHGESAPMLTVRLKPDATYLRSPRD